MAYEMGLNKWYIMSANAEEKKTRTNLKKLGCLFEAFLGALFLDFNKIQIHDEGKWFDNVFVTGPGFQMAQTFVEKVFDEHVDWMNLLQKNDNFGNGKEKFHKFMSKTRFVVFLFIYKLLIFNLYQKILRDSYYWK